MYFVPKGMKLRMKFLKMNLVVKSFKFFEISKQRLIGCMKEVEVQRVVSRAYQLSMSLSPKRSLACPTA